MLSHGSVRQTLARSRSEDGVLRTSLSHTHARAVGDVTRSLLMCQERVTTRLQHAGRRTVTDYSMTRNDQRHNKWSVAASISKNYVPKAVFYSLGSAEEGVFEMM